MNKLRWGNQSTERLLARLGPIPKSCGLRPVMGGVKYSDYQDMVVGTIVEKSSAGYLISMAALVSAILRFLPPDERVELVFASQYKYKDRVLSALSALEKWTSKSPTNHKFRTSNGLSRLAKVSFTPYEDTCLLEPADYYASALAHNFIDRHSKKSKWSSPILNDQDIGHVISREQIRNLVMDFKGKILPDLERLGLPWNEIPK